MMNMPKYVVNVSIGLNTSIGLFGTDRSPAEVFDAVTKNKDSYVSALKSIGTQYRFSFEGGGKVLIDNGIFSFYANIDGKRLQFDICEVEKNGVGGNNGKEKS